MEANERNVHSALPAVVEIVQPFGEGQVIRRQVVRVPLREVYRIEKVAVAEPEQVTEQ